MAGQKEQVTQSKSIYSVSVLLGMGHGSQYGNKEQKGENLISNFFQTPMRPLTLILKTNLLVCKTVKVTVSSGVTRRPETSCWVMSRVHMLLKTENHRASPRIS